MFLLDGEKVDSDDQEPEHRNPCNKKHVQMMVLFMRPDNRLTDRRVHIGQPVRHQRRCSDDFDSLRDSHRVLERKSQHQRVIVGASDSTPVRTYPEIPSCCYAQGAIHKRGSVTNKTARDWHESRHLPRSGSHCCMKHALMSHRFHTQRTCGPDAPAPVTKAMNV